MSAHVSCPLSPHARSPARQPDRPLRHHPMSPNPGRVLLLMTSTTYRAAAFLTAARKLGVEVTVGTDRPQALAGLNPAGHLTLDYGDPEAAARFVSAYGAQHPLGAVLAVDDDGAVI